jgi:hypothetical protein
MRPRILAGFVQGTLAALEPEVRERVRARLAPDTLGTLERSSRLAWLPIEIDVELTDAVYAELGAARAHALFRRNLTAALDTPILRSLAHGALRLFGASPERLFGWAPKAYMQLYRDAGAMRFESDGPGAARLELSLLPAAVAASRDYLDGVAAAVAAGFDLMGVDGEVRIERLDPAGRRACLRLQWEVRGGPVEPLAQPLRA